MPCPFSETVLAWRLARGLTQAALAKKSGVSRPNLSAIERGDREVTLKTLRALAAALDVRPGILADGQPPARGAGSLGREALERIAGSAAGAVRRLSDDREAALAAGLRSAMSSRIAAATSTVSRKRLKHGRSGRAADRAYFFLRTTESAAVLRSMIERTAGWQSR